MRAASSAIRSHDRRREACEEAVRKGRLPWVLSGSTTRCGARPQHGERLWNTGTKEVRAWDMSALNKQATCRLKCTVAAAYGLCLHGYSMPPARLDVLVDAFHGFNDLVHLVLFLAPKPLKMLNRRNEVFPVSPEVLLALFQVALDGLYVSLERFPVNLRVQQRNGRTGLLVMMQCAMKRDNYVWKQALPTLGSLEQSVWIQCKWTSASALTSREESIPATFE